MCLCITLHDVDCDTKQRFMDLCKKNPHLICVVVEISVEYGVQRFLKILQKNAYIEGHTNVRAISLREIRRT